MHLIIMSVCEFSATQFSVGNLLHYNIIIHRLPTRLYVCEGVSVHLYPESYIINSDIRVNLRTFI